MRKTRRSRNIRFTTCTTLFTVSRSTTTITTKSATKTKSRISITLPSTQNTAANVNLEAIKIRISE